MKRRGLNFVTEHHDEFLSESTITQVEEQLDNVAPKIVALLALGESVDTSQVRNALVSQCLVYQESLQAKKTTQRDQEELMEEEEVSGSQFKAYLCPNPGANTNMASRKQRLIFLEMDRNDPYSIMDISKIADQVIVIMSCKHTNVGGVK